MYDYPVFAIWFRMRIVYMLGHQLVITQAILHFISTGAAIAIYNIYRSVILCKLHLLFPPNGMLNWDLGKLPKGQLLM